MKKKNIENYQRIKVLNSYFSVILSITFVLFLLGVLGLFLINGKKIASGSPNEVITDKAAKTQYFGDEFNIN